MNRVFSQIVILLLVLISKISVAQFAVSGVPGMHYVDIVPDTIVDPMIGNITGSHYPPDKFYEFDMNQDGTNDIKILCHAHLAMNSASNSVLVSCLNSSFSVGYGTTDSTYNNYLTYWMVRDILKKYSANDTINKTSFIPISSCYLAFYLGQTGSYATSDQWVDTNDSFFGVRYINAGDTMYGWVKVNISTLNNCTIKEYSLGSSYTGIKENTEQCQILISPNPANDNIVVSYKENNIDDILLVQLYNSSGKIVSEFEDLSNPIIISNFTNGLYFIRIKTKTKVFTNKVIVTH